MFIMQMGMYVLLEEPNVCHANENAYMYIAKRAICVSC